MKIVYEHKDFCISRDRYQWILGVGKSISKGKVSFRSTTYHPTLSLLLGDLAEQFFRNETKELKTLEGLQDSITRVYELILMTPQPTAHSDLKGSRTKKD